MSDRDLQEFSEACGAIGPLILGVDEPGADRTSWRIFDHPFAVVGRGAGVDLMLDDPQISRRHAYFQVIEGRVFCVDLLSRTGTRWGEDSAIWGWVDADSGVQVGPYRVRIKKSETVNLPAVINDEMRPVPAMPTSRGSREGRPADYEVEVRSPSGTLQGWRISRSLVLIGQSRVCKLRFEAEGIGGVHAAILQTSDGLFVIDLLSADGTALNGRPIRWSRLDRGDVISVGRYQVHVRTAQPLPALAGQGRTSKPGRVEAKETIRISSPAEVGSPEFQNLVEELGSIQRESDQRFQQVVLTILQTFAAQHREQMDLTRSSLAQLVAIAETHRELAGRHEERGAVMPPALHLVSGDPRVADTAPRARRPGRPQSTAPDRAAAESVHLRTVTAPADPDLPTLLYDRLAELQKERSGRWQRLMGSLIGKAP